MSRQVFPFDLFWTGSRDRNLKIQKSYSLQFVCVLREYINQSFSYTKNISLRLNSQLGVFFL